MGMMGNEMDEKDQQRIMVLGFFALGFFGLLGSLIVGPFISSALLGAFVGFGVGALILWHL